MLLVMRDESVVIDLNPIPIFCQLQGVFQPRSLAYEQRTHRFLAAHRSPACPSIQQVRHTLQRRLPCPQIHVLGPVSLPVVRAADLSRKPARHRLLPASDGQQALPCWYSWPHLAQHSGRCKRTSRLAHLRRLCSDPHREGAEALSTGELRCRARPYCLRVRLDHDRPVPVALSVGTVSPPKKCRETSHLD